MPDRLLQLLILIALYFGMGTLYPDFYAVADNAYYVVVYGYLPIALKHPLTWVLVAIFVIARFRRANWGKILRKFSPHGTSEWASWKWLKEKGLFAPDGLFLGQIQLFDKPVLRNFFCRDLYHHGEGHFITIAAPGGGKSTALVVPVLLEAKHGSFLVSDPKGELTAITRRHRETCSKVVYLNPFFRDYERHTGLEFPDSGFNPFDAMIDDENLHTAAGNFSRLLCVTDRRNSNTYFDNDGAIFLALCIIWITRYEPPENRNLAYLYELVRRDPNATFDAMEHVNDPYVSHDAGKYRRMYKTSPGQWQGVVSKAEIATDRYVPTSPLANHTSESGLDPALLKKEDVTVYILIPTKHIRTAAPWLNMVIGLLGDSMGEIETARPVTFLLDELPALGFLPDLRRHMRQYRGAGLRMWLFSQTISALTDPELYGDRGTEDIFGICDTKQFFNIEELPAARMISELCGEKTEIGQSTNTSDHDLFNLSTLGVPLIRPEEIMKLGKNEQIIIKYGQPIKANLVPYFTREKWQEITDKNPYREE